MYPADDLRVRLRVGDLSALTDPALPLELLADPGAAWWWAGAAACASAVVHGLATGLDAPRVDLARALLVWARSQRRHSEPPSSRGEQGEAPQGDQAAVPRDPYADHGALLLVCPREQIFRHVFEIARLALLGCAPKDRACALLALGQQLRALGPTGSARELEALAVLERLVQG